MTKKEEVLPFLLSLFPDAKCELDYQKDYELLIAIILSAQCTDKRVNTVTKKMFAKYQSLEDIQKAPQEDIENDIKSLGMYKAKARNIKKTVDILISEYQGIVPREKKDLVSLPGVGIKTANVFRSEWYKEPEIAVDTHVERVSKRLGFAQVNDDVFKVEQRLRKAFNKDEYIKVHHLFIHFGRYFCKAINPSCQLCQLKDKCQSYNSKLTSKR